MKLPDFQQCVEIRQLQSAMGVIEIPSLPELPPFEREIVEQVVHEYPDPQEIQIDEQLKINSIPIHKSELQGKLFDLLTWEGRKVRAYIRDQRSAVDFASKRSGYRYHLCNCQTMQSMKDQGREKRFLATNRDDGYFEVYDTTLRDTPHGVVKMNLCQHCIKILKQKGLYFHPFDLAKYFRINDSYIPKKNTKC